MNEQLVEDFSKKYLGRFGIHAIGFDINFKGEPYIFCYSILNPTVVRKCIKEHMWFDMAIVVRSTKEFNLRNDIRV